MEQGKDISDKSVLNIANDQVEERTIRNKNLNLSQEKELLLSVKYHVSEIEQNDTICKTTILFLWAGFIIIIVGIVLSYFKYIDVGIIATVSGIIIDFISGIVFVFLTKSSKNKQEYFRQLSLEAERNDYLKFCENFSNEDKMIIITKLTDDYCERNKR